MIRQSGTRRTRFQTRLPIAATLASMLLTLVAGGPALAQTAAAENYVSEEVQKGLAILGNHNIPAEERREQFRQFLTSLIDTRTMALFTLGPARRSATPEQINDYVDAFRNYIVAVYESKLESRADQYLKVTGASEQSPDEYVVRTVLVDPTRSAGQHSSPMEVDFRVTESNGHFAVVDASIVGVWLSIQERDQFANYLADNVGNVGGLVAHLKALTERLHGSGSTRSEG